MLNSDTPSPALQPRQKRLSRRINNALVYAAMRRSIRECRPATPVLMAPCGYGWFFERFRRDGIEVVGMDIVPANVAWARAAVNPPMEVHEGNILHMPFTDDQFDFVISNRFLLHFADDFRAKAIRELARVTRRHLLVHYDVPFSLRQVVRKLRGAMEPHHDPSQDPGWKSHKRKDRKQYCTREMMDAEGALAGLKIKKLYSVCWLFSDRVYCLFEK